MFKKHSIIVLVLILAFTFCLASCKKNNKENLLSGENSNTTSGSTENSSGTNSQNGEVTLPNGQTGSLTEDGKGIVAEGTGSIPSGRNEYNANSNSSKVDTNTTPSNYEPVHPSVTSQPSSSSSNSSSNKPVPSKDITFKQFLELSGAEQEAFADSFASLDEFADWYRAAQKAQEEEDKKNENYVVGDGSIDIRDYID